MACNSTIFLFLVAVFLGLLAFASGDAALINNVCGKTANPGSCHKCFNEYTRSSGEDVKALGRTSIDCASSQSLNVMSDVGNHVATATNKEKEAYVDCSLKLQTGDQKIASALQSWQTGHYVDAGNLLLDALQAARDCSAGLQKFNPPPSVGDGLTTLQGFCEAANGVLRQIH
ncbi:pectinesterase inhibitor 2-like [Alnus glutinosa]|uniref:pectinesterase inhibitor 2-like n=1 Tax=Alnus glutinosa TaxID=3517 RepID=UPI002D797341|nr:pectinesterase inhibitor 2-like [Alnus glutinosa]